MKNIYYDKFERQNIAEVGIVDTYFWRGEPIIVIIGACLKDMFFCNKELIQNDGILAFTVLFSRKWIRNFK